MIIFICSPPVGEWHPAAGRLCTAFFRTRPRESRHGRSELHIGLCVARRQSPASGLHRGSGGDKLRAKLN
jgi:hypothetical protein